jgi:hypothetical protein
MASIFVVNCDSNLLFENNFSCENNYFEFDGGANSWDNGSVGNYWADYLTKYPNATEIAGTGVGDTPYVLDANNVDHYPLTAPVDTVAPSVLALSPENKSYETSSIPLNFIVNEPLLQIEYSLDGEKNVTIEGNTTLTGLANGGHNLTVYVWDEAGNVGASETLSFTVDVPFPTTLVAVASGVSLGAVGLGIVVYFKKRKR